MSEEKALAEAIRWYRGSVDLLVRAGDELSETQAKEKDRITQELARCEAALDTAKKPLHTH